MSKLRRVDKVSTWRRIAIASWVKPNDPTCYGTLALDAGPAKAYLAKIRAETGVKATITHLVGRAVALAIRDTPEINGRIVGRRLLQRDTVDLFFQAVVDDAGDLSGAKIDRCDEKDVHQIAGALQERVERIRARRDPMFQKSKSTVDKLPRFILGPTIRFMSYLSNDRGWDLSALQLPPDQFGSAMITSVGMFGIDLGYAPIFPLANTPLVILVGEIKDTPVAGAGEKAGQVVLKPTINLNVSFDHRFIDGFHAGRMARSVRRYFEAPEAFTVDKLADKPQARGQLPGHAP
jgi:pyruvate dehydrogenase E2 component (dihydrolipoamide acetyltransferase)